MRSQSIVGYSQDREENDFYPTPPEATKAIMERESFDGDIWECACGDGRMSEVIKDYGYNVISTDLVYRGYGEGGVNFLEVLNPKAKTIITNPPYKHAEKFIRHARNIGVRKMALLLKLAFLEGQARLKLFHESPPKKVYVFSQRLTMTKNGEPLRGGGMIAYAWYVWDFTKFGSKPYIDWI